MKKTTSRRAFRGTLEHVENYGFFDDDRKEFVVTTPFTPRPWENRLWNDRFNLQISNHGTGIAYTKDTKGKHVLFNYHCPNRVLYVMDRTTGTLWSPAHCPVNEPLDSYECRHGLKHTSFRSKKDSLEVIWQVTVHKKDCAELWRVEVSNSGKKTKNISIVPFYQVDLSLEDPYFGGVDRFHSFVSKKRNLIYVKNCAYVRQGEDDALALHADLPILRFEMNTQDFLKDYSSLNRPETVLANRWNNSFIDDDAQPCLAADFPIVLRAGESKSLNLQIYTAVNLADAEKKAESYSKAPVFDLCMQHHKSRSSRILGLCTLKTDDAILDRYVNVWIKHQLWYNAEWNRGWGMGFRDSMSDCDAFRAFDPPLVRKRILQAAAHIYDDGHTVRSFFPTIEKPYFDGGTWFQNALCQFLKETGDWSLLEEKVPYFQSAETDTILGHAKRTVEFLNRQRGPDNICRMGFGDWNDAVGGIDREGRGQSIWTTMAFIFGLRSMAPLLEKLGDPDAKIYSTRADELTDLLNTKFFEGDRYIRAVTDAGRRIGSKKEKEGRIYIEPQGWSLFTGVADSEKAAAIVAAMRRELYVPYGVLLLSPPYTEYREDVGRISNDPAGTVENGSNYVQGMLFYTYGLTRAGFPDEAHELLHRVLPTNPENPPAQALIEPFQITNSFQGPASKHPGRAMFSWRTGSAGWLMKTVWDGMLGIRPDLDDLEIDARLPRAFGDKVLAERTIRGRRITFEFLRKTKKAGTSANCLQVKNPTRLRYEDLKRISRIQVLLE